MHSNAAGGDALRRLYRSRTVLTRLLTILVKFFFIVHDPTQLNRQGPDIGSQYRSGIYTTSAAQQAAAEKVRSRLQEEDAFKGRRIVTEIEPAKPFWMAENYHQDYIVKTGRACHVNIPAALEAIGIKPEERSTSSSGH